MRVGRYTEKIIHVAAENIKYNMDLVSRFRRASCTELSFQIGDLFLQSVCLFLGLCDVDGMLLHRSKVFQLLFQFVQLFRSLLKSC